MRNRVIRHVCLAIAMSGLLAGCSGGGDAEHVEPQNESVTNSPKLGRLEARGQVGVSAAIPGNPVRAEPHAE